MFTCKLDLKEIRNNTYDKLIPHGYDEYAKLVPQTHKLKFGVNLIKKKFNLMTFQRFFLGFQFDSAYKVRYL